jgi:hypothetical protein
MGTIKRFEDIVAGQAAGVLVKDTYGATQQGAFGRNFGLRDQMQRAAVSVMSNIAEGYERGSSREFRHFYILQKLLQAKFAHFCMSPMTLVTSMSMHTNL